MTENQMELSLEVAKSAEIEGIEMGVLKDGTAYVSARGMSEMCGMVPSAIISNGGDFRRGANINSGFSRYMREKGFSPETLFFEVEIAGTKTHCYTEKAVLAILQYYGFDVDLRYQQPKARENLLRLAQAGFREFVYRMVGYTPTLPKDAWRHFHDRLLLNPAPNGYFSVFKESAELIVAAINDGLTVDAHTVPDGSVGTAWANHWKENNLEDQYGPRQKHPFEYPDYFPQAAATIDANVYPLDALGAFRRWLSDVYVPEKYPNYIKGQIKKGSISERNAQRLIAATKRPALPVGARKQLAGDKP